jgi:hypothetical protein
MGPQNKIDCAGEDQQQFTRTNLQSVAMANDATRVES